MPIVSTHHINSMMVRNMVNPGHGFIGAAHTNNSTADSFTLQLPASSRSGDYILIACLGTLDNPTKPAARGITDMFNSYGASWDVEMWRWDHGGGAALDFTTCGTGEKSWLTFGFRGYSNSGHQWDGLASGQPDCPSITNTNNVIALALSNDNNPSGVTFPSGYERELFTIDLGNRSAVAGIKWGTSGTENPAAYAGFSSTDWTAVSIDIA